MIHRTMYLYDEHIYVALLRNMTYVCMNIFHLSVTVPLPFTDVYICIEISTYAILYFRRMLNFIGKFLTFNFFLMFYAFIRLTLVVQVRHTMLYTLISFNNITNSSFRISASRGMRTPVILLGLCLPSHAPVQDYCLILLSYII